MAVYCMYTVIYRLQHAMRRSKYLGHGRMCPSALRWPCVLGKCQRGRVSVVTEKTTGRRGDARHQATS